MRLVQSLEGRLPTGTSDTRCLHSGQCLAVRTVPVVPASCDSGPQRVGHRPDNREQLTAQNATTLVRVRFSDAAPLNGSHRGERPCPRFVGRAAVCLNWLSMKPHHAAAIALVGWYLMLPPSGSSPAGVISVRIDAPMSEWSNFAAYDTASACEKERLAYQSQRLNTADHPREAAAAKWSFDSSLCIASDDPRIKEK